MKDFVIITDSCSDLERKYIDENNIPFAMLTCRIGNQEYKDDFGTSLPYSKFYDLMRSGEVPKTSQPNTNDFYEIFREQAEKNVDILYIGVSSGLSGTLSPAHVAENMIQDEFEGVEIYIFDTLTASLGEGLMVMKALELKKNGASMMEIVDYLETHVQKLNTYILFFAGLELAASARDIGPEKSDFYLLIVTAGFSLWNIGIGFVAGLIMQELIKRKIFKIC